ncbi:MAG: Mll0713 protein, partial [uncultured Rubellimicrobium sp.]
DLLCRAQARPRTRVHVRHPHECGPRQHLHLPQDVHLDRRGRDRDHAHVRRQPRHDPVRHLDDRRTQPRAQRTPSGHPPASLDVPGRQVRRHHAARGHLPARRGRAARRVLLQRHDHRRRTGEGGRAAPVPHLPGRQLHRGGGGYAIPPDRGIQVRPPHPRARLRPGHELRGVGQAPPRQLRFHHQGQPVRGPAARPPYLRTRQPPKGPEPPDQGQRRLLPDHQPRLGRCAQAGLRQPPRPRLL